MDLPSGRLGEIFQIHNLYFPNEYRAVFWCERSQKILEFLRLLMNGTLMFVVTADLHNNYKTIGLLFMDYNENDNGN